MHAPARSLVSSRRRRAVLTGALAAAALTAVPGAASAAIHVENAMSIRATQGLRLDHQRVVAFDEAGACQPGAYQVTINWGDGTAPDATGKVVKALEASPGTCTYGAEGSHTYEQTGQFEVAVTVCHPPECITTPVGGQVRVDAAPTVATAPAPAPAPAAEPEQTAQAEAAQSAPAGGGAVIATAGQAVVATPALGVHDPVSLSQLRRHGLRLRLDGGAITGRTVTVVLRDPSRDKTLARLRVAVGAQAGARTTLRLHFPRKALRHVRRGHRYGLLIPRGGGLPSLAVVFRVR